MRLILLALLLSAGPLATGQPNPSPSQEPTPTPCKSPLLLIEPSPGACLDALSPFVASDPAARPNLNWTDRFLQPVKTALPSQLMAHDPNPFFALNQSGPLAIPYIPPRGKAEPIPTTWPNAHVEKIPTTWPNLKLLLIYQPPGANAATESKQK